MAETNDYRRDFFDSLVNEGYTFNGTTDYDEYEKAMADPDRARKIYNATLEDGWEHDDFDTFYSDYGPQSNVARHDGRQAGLHEAPMQSAQNTKAEQEAASRKRVDDAVNNMRQYRRQTPSVDYDNVRHNRWEGFQNAQDHDIEKGLLDYNDGRGEHEGGAPYMDDMQPNYKGAIDKDKDFIDARGATTVTAGNNTAGTVAERNEAGGFDPNAAMDAVRDTMQQRVDTANASSFNADAANADVQGMLSEEQNNALAEASRQTGVTMNRQEAADNEFWEKYGKPALDEENAKHYEQYKKDVEGIYRNWNYGSSVTGIAMQPDLAAMGKTTDLQPTAAVDATVKRLDESGALSEYIMKSIGLNPSGNNSGEGTPLTDEEKAQIDAMYGAEYMRVAQMLQEKIHNDYAENGAPKGVLDYILSGAFNDNLYATFRNALLRSVDNDFSLRERLRLRGVKKYEEEFAAANGTWAMAGVMGAKGAATMLVEYPVFKMAGVAGNKLAQSVTRDVATVMFGEAGADIGMRYLSMQPWMKFTNNVIQSGTTFGLYGGVSTTAQLMANPYDENGNIMSFGEYLGSIGTEALKGGIIGAGGFLFRTGAGAINKAFGNTGLGAKITEEAAGYLGNVGVFSTMGTIEEYAHYDGKEPFNWAQTFVKESVKNAAMFALMDLPKIKSRLKERGDYELTDADYDALKRYAREGKSFTDVLKSIVREKEAEIDPEGFDGYDDFILDTYGSIISDKTIPETTKRKLKYIVEGVKTTEPMVYNVKIEHGEKGWKVLTFDETGKPVEEIRVGGQGAAERVAAEKQAEAITNNITAAEAMMQETMGMAQGLDQIVFARMDVSNTYGINIDKVLEKPVKKRTHKENEAVYAYMQNLQHRFRNMYVDPDIRMIEDATDANGNVRTATTTDNKSGFVSGDPATDKSVILIDPVNGEKSQVLTRNLLEIGEPYPADDAVRALADARNPEVQAAESEAAKQAAVEAARQEVAQKNAEIAKANEVKEIGGKRWKVAKDDGGTTVWLQNVDDPNEVVAYLGDDWDALPAIDVEAEKQATEEAKRIEAERKAAEEAERKETERKQKLNEIELQTYTDYVKGVGSMEGEQLMQLRATYKDAIENAEGKYSEDVLAYFRGKLKAINEELNKRRGLEEAAAKAEDERLKAAATRTAADAKNELLAMNRQTIVKPDGTKKSVSGGLRGATKEQMVDMLVKRGYTQEAAEEAAQWMVDKREQFRRNVGDDPITKQVDNAMSTVPDGYEYTEQGLVLNALNMLARKEGLRFNPEDGNVPEEIKAKDYLMDELAPTIDELAHDMWENRPNGSQMSTEDYRDAIMEALRESGGTRNGALDAIKERAAAYNPVDERDTPEYREIEENHGYTNEELDELGEIQADLAKKAHDEDSDVVRMDAGASAEEPKQEPKNQKQEPKQEPKNQNEEPTGNQEEPKSEYGKGNKFFTEDKAEEARKKLREFFNKAKMGIDPTIIKPFIDLAGYHIEAGIRKFADFCRAMIKDLGDGCRPYLAEVYQMAKHDPDIKKLNVDRKEWTSEDDVYDFDVDGFKVEEEASRENAAGTVAVRPVEKPAAEKPVEKPAEKPAENPNANKPAEPNNKEEKKPLEKKKPKDLLDLMDKAEQNMADYDKQKKNKNNGGQRKDENGSLGEENRQKDEQPVKAGMDQGGNRDTAADGMGGRGMARPDDSRPDEAEGYAKEVKDGENAQPSTAAQKETAVETPKAETAGEADGTVTEVKTAGTAANRRNYHEERGAEVSEADQIPTANGARVKANLAAIATLRKLQRENREATPEEMKVLGKFTGWGGLGSTINLIVGRTRYGNTAMQERANALSADMRKLVDEAELTNEELEAMALSAQSAYYTPDRYIDALWDVARQLGFKGGKIMEGSAGIGRILARIPDDMNGRSSIEAVELERLSGGMLEKMYPDAQVHVRGFEKVTVPAKSVDVAITNVPFGTDMHVNDPINKDLSKRFGNLHDFCIAKNVRALKEGGIGIFITTSGTMDKSTSLRKWVTTEGDADFIGAFRLPNNTFGGTPVTADIVVIRKRVGGKRSVNAIDADATTVLRTVAIPTGNRYDKASKSYDPEQPVTRNNHQKGQEIVEYKPLEINKYFADHPEYMGGEMFVDYEKGETFRGGKSQGLYPKEGMDVDGMLKNWVSGLKAEETGSNAGDNAVGKAQRTGAGKNGTEKTGAKNGSLVVAKDGTLKVAQNGELVDAEINTNKVTGADGKKYEKAAIVKDYGTLKDAVQKLLDYQTSHDTDEGLKPLLDAANRAYDNFVKKYGTLNKNNRLRFMENDAEFPSVQAIEKASESVSMDGKKTVTADKADVLKGRVIHRMKQPEPKNAKDAVIASVFMNGKVDLDWVAEKLGISKDEAEKQVLEAGVAFKDPQTGSIEPSYEYLSGNVRQKLQYAEDYKEQTGSTEYDKNIEALRKVVPADIPAHLINFNLGSTWIDGRLYSEYMSEKFGMSGVMPVRNGSTWVIPDADKPYNKNVAAGVRSNKPELNGRQYMGAELLEAAMNNRMVEFKRVVKDRYTGETEVYTDPEATQVALQKIDEMKEDFKEWAKNKVKSDAELGKKIQKDYNDKYNCEVPLRIGEEFLPEKFEGASDKFSLYPHQKKAVMRCLTAPTLFAHEAGTGKTFTMITAAMEMRRLGTAKKPVIVVQNATTFQFAASAMQLYPNAKVMVMPGGLSPERRKNYFNQIRYNDWDMVIMAQSVFNEIPDSPERKAAYIREKIDELEALIADNEAAASSGGDRGALGNIRRDLENQLAEQVEKLTDVFVVKPEKKQKSAKDKAKSEANTTAKAENIMSRKVDDVANWDDFGVDALFVDEAHYYKKLGYVTSMTRGVKGIDSSQSERAVGAYLKMQSILEASGGKNVILATGTPISNTAGEMWTFMKYLMTPEKMKENDIYYFDDFVRNFGQIAQSLEFKTNGKFDVANRFGAYMNVPELMRLWNVVTDTVLRNSEGAVNDKLPDVINDNDGSIKHGKDNPTDIFVPQNESVIKVMRAIKAELERFDNMDGKEKKENSSIPLVMFGLAKRVAIDPRLVIKNGKDEPASKVNRCVDDVLRILGESSKYNGTVAIFCEQNTRWDTVLDGAGKPVKDSKGKVKKVAGFNVFEDMKRKLVERGIPENQIAIITSGMKPSVKEKIFEKVNSGEIRVVMGNKDTLGTGVNIQERLAAVAHLDVPDRPSDYEQENARVLRQGNMHKEWGLPIRILRYGVEDTLDVTGYQRLAIKSNFIGSIMNGNKFLDNSMTERTLEEEDENVFGSTVAQLSGSEYAMLKEQAERQLRKYRNEYRNWKDDQAYVENVIKRSTQGIEESEAMLEKVKARRKAIEDLFPDKTVKTIEVDGKTYSTTEEQEELWKEINKALREFDDTNRNNANFYTKTLEWNMKVNGVGVVIRASKRRTSSYENGQTKNKMNTELSLEIPSLNNSWKVDGQYPKNAVTYLQDKVMSLEQSDKSIRFHENNIEDYKNAIKTVEPRRGEEFKHYEELELAANQVEEYTQLMKEELDEKDAKYADAVKGEAIDDIWSLVDGMDDGTTESGVEAMIGEPEEVDLSKPFAGESALSYAKRKVAMYDMRSARTAKEKNDALNALVEAAQPNTAEEVKGATKAVVEQIGNILGKDGLLFEQQDEAMRKMNDGEAMFVSDLARLVGTKYQEEVEKAFDMYHNGMPIEDIEKETGVFIAADGNVRKEINDLYNIIEVKSFLNELGLDSNNSTNNREYANELIEGAKEVALGKKDMYSMSARKFAETAKASDMEFFKIYPELEDYTVVLKKEIGNGRFAEFDDTNKVIRISLEGLLTKKTSFAHELQHFIQRSEKRDFGANDVTLRNNPEMAGDAGRIRKWDSIFDRYGDLGKAGLNKEEYRERVNELVKESGLSSEKELIRKYYREGSFGTAWKSWGETEARNAGARHFMSAEERKALPPTSTEDVPRSEQIESPTYIEYRRRIKNWNAIAEKHGFEKLDEPMITESGTLYGYADSQDRVHLTENGLNPETPLHEYSHLWLRCVIRGNKELWNHIKNLMKDIPSEIWDTVRKNYPHLSEEGVYREVFGTYMGKRGRERMERDAAEAIKKGKSWKDRAFARELFHQIRKAIEKAKAWIAENVLGIDPKRFKNIDDVFEKTYYDFANGFDPRDPNGSGRKGAQPSTAARERHGVEMSIAGGGSAGSAMVTEVKNLQGEIDALKAGGDVKGVALRVEDFIKNRLSAAAAQRLGKRQMQTIVRRINEATTAEQMREPLRTIQRVINEAQEEAQLTAMGRLLAFKSRSKNAHGIAVGSKIDADTQHILGMIRSMYANPMKTIVDAELTKERSAKDALIKDICERVGIDSAEGINRTVTDAMRAADPVLDEMMKHLEEARNNIHDLKEERDSWRMQNVEEDLINVQNAIEDLNNTLTEKAARGETPTREEIITHDVILPLREKLALLRKALMAEPAGEEAGGVNYWQKQYHRLSGEAAKVKPVSFEVTNKDGSKKTVTMGNQDEYDRRMKEAGDAEYMLMEAQERANRLSAEVTERLQDLIGEGRSRWKAQQEADRTRKKNLIRMAVSEIKDKPLATRSQKDNEERNNGVTKKVAALAKKAGAFMDSFDYVLQRITPNARPMDGKLYDYFMKDPETGVVAANDRYKTGVREATDAVRAKSKEIFGKELDGAIEDARKEETTITIIAANDIRNASNGEDKYMIPAGSEIPVRMDKDKALYLWAAWRQTDGRMKMEHEGWTEENMHDVERFLGDKWIKFGEYITEELLPELRDTKYAETYRKMFNTDMAKIDHYFPLKINKNDVKPAEPTSNNPNYVASLSTPNIIERTHNVLPLDADVRFTDVLRDYIDNQEHWNALAPVIRDLNTLITSPTFKAMLEANEKGSYEVFYRAAQTATQSQQRENYHPVDAFFGEALRSGLLSNIAFNFNSALKQLLSAPAFWAYRGDAKYMADMMIPVRWGRDEKGKIVSAKKWCEENLPAFRERMEQDNAGLEYLNVDNFDTKVGQIAAKYGLWANRQVDLLTVAWGAKAVYEAALRKHKRMGHTDAHERAVIEAEIAFNQSQQSSRPEFSAPAQKSGSMFSQSVGAYQNANISYGRMVREGWMEMTNAKKVYDYDVRHGMDENDAKKKMRESQGHGLWQMLIVAALVGAWGAGTAGLANLYMHATNDDDENKAFKDILLQMAVMPAVYGTYVAPMTSSWMSGYDYDPIAIFKDANDLRKKVFAEDPDYKDAALTLANFITTYKYGINWYGENKPLNNWYHIITEDAYRAYKDGEHAPYDAYMIAAKLLSLPVSQRRNAAVMFYKQYGPAAVGKAELLVKSTALANNKPTDVAKDYVKAVNYAFYKDLEELSKVAGEYDKKTTTDAQRKQMRETDTWKRLGWLYENGVWGEFYRRSAWAEAKKNHTDGKKIDNGLMNYIKDAIKKQDPARRGEPTKEDKELNAELQRLIKIWDKGRQK